ncbi:caspase, EACC1-associated type [Nocardia takedensis]|uniref:caspase, EACC1-associated type n=1 Tax=Nocardia takedensis TaxID=259390 RepID=UPI003F765B17
MTRHPDPADSCAVLIGVTRYSDARLPEIPSVATNLTDLREALVAVSAGGFHSESITVLHDPAHSRQIGQAVRSAAQRAGDVLLVYYAGHGLLDQRGALHLTLPDSDPDQIGWTTLSFETLRHEILDSPAAVRVLILDCCFSGRAFEVMGDSTAAVKGQVQIEGTYTLVSSAANQTSFAPTGARNTAFTAALLASVRQTPGLTLDDLFRDVDRRLSALGHPRPHRRSVDTAGDLVLFSGSDLATWLYRVADLLPMDCGPNLGIYLTGRNSVSDFHRWLQLVADRTTARAVDSGDDLDDTILMVAASLLACGLTDSATDFLTALAGVGDTLGQMLLAAVKAVQGDIDQAEAALQEMADSDQTRAATTAALVLAITHAGRGDIEQAEMRLRQATTRQVHAVVAGFLGLLLAARGEAAEAETWFVKATEVHADETQSADEFEPPPPSLLLALFLIGRGALPEVWLPYWMTEIDDEGRREAAPGYILAAVNPGSAIEFARQRAEKTDDPEELAVLSGILAVRGYIQEAEQLLREAAAGGASFAMTVLGYLLAGRGFVNDAERWIRKGAATGDALAMMHLGIFLRGTGDIAQSDTWIKNASDKKCAPAAALLAYLG